MRHSLQNSLSAALSAILLVTTSCQTIDSSASAEMPAPAESSVTTRSVLDQMDWLAGNWSGDMWGGRFVAHYTTPEGGMIISHSRLLINGQVNFYEFEVFEPEGDGVHFQPFPGGEPADGLSLTSHDVMARRAVFENKDKDFPTRIVFERVADDHLVITLSDPHGGSDEVETFNLFR
jgi:hypothetical protein